MRDSAKIPLLYIAGSSHSGSTLLDFVLGSHSRIESLGEAKKIPQILEKIRARIGAPPICSCHVPIPECSFWKFALRLGDESFPEREAITTELSADLGLARRALGFRGREVLLDSSKNLGRLGFLSACPEFLITCVHLTRDPRAVAFSAVRKMEKKTASLDSRTRWRILIKQATDWAKLNRKIRARYHSKRSVSYLALRYEDFVSAPRDAVSRVLNSMGLQFEPAQLRFRDFSHHNIEGNRLRLERGSEIHFDAGYLNEMSTGEWLALSFLLLPSLVGFGYSLRRRGPVL
jgi:hypothetical protein